MASRPRIKAQQLAAQRIELRHRIVGLFKFTRIAGKGLANGVGLFLPQADAFGAQALIVRICREHRDILRHPHLFRRHIGAHAMRLQGVEDQQIARFHIDIDDCVAGDIGFEGIAASGLVVIPGVDLGKDAGHSLKAADLAALLFQRQQALHRDRQRPL